MASTNSVSSNDNTSIIDIVQFKEEHYPQLVKVFNEGFGSKRCLFCFPGSKSQSEFIQNYKRSPKKKELLFVAIDTITDTLLGFVQLCKPGVPAFWGMHNPKKNEVYVEQLGVSSQARGRGVGTKLLQFSEEFARNQPGIEILTLEVLKGNRAVGLYQRFGFEIVPEKNPLTKCLSICCIFVCMGRPYGLCNPEWGSHSMVKKL